MLLLYEKEGRGRLSPTDGPAASHLSQEHGLRCTLWCSLPCRVLDSLTGHLGEHQKDRMRIGQVPEDQWESVGMVSYPRWHCCHRNGPFVARHGCFITLLPCQSIAVMVAKEYSLSCACMRRQSEGAG